MSSDQEGFTLVEVLVVILITSILASIAFTVFYNQRLKAFSAQQQSSLKDAGNAIESYGVANDGDFSGLDELEGCCGSGSAGAELKEEGFFYPEWYKGTGSFKIEADDGSYCIEALHAGFDGSEDWAVATLRSATGNVPSAEPDSCPEL